MDTDKNKYILEKQLRTLGQKVRIDILKKLKNSQTPLSFSRLQKEVLGNDLSSVNLSFHLNTLKKSELVDASDDGYSITILGSQIIDKILSIEQILNLQHQSIMIRTSKYSKEPFDVSKIEEYLVAEGELERYLARQIAREVEERLSKTNIEYMTAPLMREYINVILLENGLEEVRHRLTRLGTPPFEVSKLFNSNNNVITPETFIDKLGSDVSEQYLLLNLIPKNLADLYLSGEIALLNLNYWALRPLSLYISANSLIDYLSSNVSKSSHTISEDFIHTKHIIQFSDLLYVLKKFCSDDLVLGNFNCHFLSLFSLPKAISFDLPLLCSRIIKFNNSFNKERPSLTLEFNYNEKCSNQNLLDEIFLKLLNTESKNLIKPSLLFEYSTFFSSGLKSNILYDLIVKEFKDNLIFYDRNYSYLFNSTKVQIADPYSNQIILDKILINLPMISFKAKQNDETFLDLLHEKLLSVFELFTHKEKLVQKKLDNLKEWNTILSNIFNSNKKNIFKNALKSVSFFGLNEAVLHHCGIELDRTKNSESFALKILSTMKMIIEEKNKLNGDQFILSQPHDDCYLQDCCHDTIIENNQYMKGYSSSLIRSESNLSLNKKISLFKKFQRIFGKGSLFSLNINETDSKLEKLFKTIIESEIGATLLTEY
ncbi:MAG: anaerobic ribonucleoside-triphosphate reductase [Candidatus Odinarchaeota archaeon]